MGEWIRLDGELVTNLPDEGPCSCATVYVGLRDSGAKNLNPDCPQHGVGVAQPSASLNKEEPQ